MTFAGFKKYMRQVKGQKVRRSGVVLQNELFIWLLTQLHQLSEKHNANLTHNANPAAMFSPTLAWR